MDRIIAIKVSGSHVAKESNFAGVQHEANARVMRIEFDDGWDGYAKTVTFWNALGKNPVKRTLTADLLENVLENTRVYLCPIPKEAMTEAGNMQFVVDGYADGKHQRSVSDKLRVDPAPYAEDAGYPSDPTPSQAEQLQVQIDTILQNISTETARAVSGAAQAANSESVATASASSAALSAGNAAVSAQVASEARAAAEKAALMAQTVVGGNYAGIEYVDSAIAAAVASIPSPDVSGQIDTHNASTAAHSDIRSLATAAQNTASGKVSKSGDTMTGSLQIDISGQRNIVSVNQTAKIAYMQYNDPANRVAANLGLSNTQIYYQTTSDMKTWAKYPLLHTGNKSQIFTYGTEALVEGVSTLETGKLYFVYE